MAGGPVCVVCMTATAVVTVADPAGNTADVCGPCWRRLEKHVNGIKAVSLTPHRKTTK